MMRKAEMAAKVTQIKRLSELEMADESEEDEAHLQTAPSHRLRLRQLPQRMAKPRKSHPAYSF